MTLSLQPRWRWSACLSVHLSFDLSLHPSDRVRWAWELNRPLHLKYVSDLTLLQKRAFLGYYCITSGLNRVNQISHDISINFQDTLLVVRRFFCEGVRQKKRVWSADTKRLIWHLQLDDNMEAVKKLTFLHVSPRIGQNKKKMKRNGREVKSSLN